MNEKDKSNALLENKNERINDEYEKKKRELDEAKYLLEDTKK